MVKEVPVAIPRDELIAICEAAVVPVDKWRNRDTASAQEQLGTCWALLRAGADFYVNQAGETLWVYLTYPGFAKFDYGGHEDQNHFYLPTRERLTQAAGSDWY